MTNRDIGWTHPEQSAQSLDDTTIGHQEHGREHERYKEAGLLVRLNRQQDQRGKNDAGANCVVWGSVSKYTWYEAQTHLDSCGQEGHQKDSLSHLGGRGGPANPHTRPPPTTRVRVSWED